MNDVWVLDATLAGDDGPPYPFCPLEEDRVVVGMTFVSDKPPGKLVGLYHADGDEALGVWLDWNRKHIRYLYAEVPYLDELVADDG